MFKTLVVVDDNLPTLLESLPGAISFEEYLRDYPKLNEPKTRIINLCDTTRYLSKGYYCSLLAEARGHSVLPSVKTINKLRGDDNLWSIDSRLSHLVPKDDTESVLICLGKVAAPHWQKLATRIFQRHPTPLLKLKVHRVEDQRHLNLQRCSFNELSSDEHNLLLEALEDYTKSTWRKHDTGKRYRWDMAILVNHNETVPPSNKGAITRFVKAAAKLGINAQPVSVDDLLSIEQYDALFIRETTAIDHYTYRLARKAEENGLVVLDDPDSILRCCNKVYLHDAFNYQKVPSLSTRVINSLSETSLDEIEQQFGYPLVLKMPEGSFSKGVYKIEQRQMLKEKLAELFQDSALVLAQEYLYTDHDWRVGVLNGRAIYACRYYMARNHWQIYNHGSKRFSSGNYDTLPTFEVPKTVLDAALKACKIIGSGLYGVDIKVSDNRAYVLEVNDNPSIDHKVEDAYLGEELYMQVMSEFLRRLELRGR
ncbi:MAG: RimK family protein [Porticoccaceae bacterium]|nr:RimK family protein [Pseudomonadales bacterium]MCP5172108.1 RimK family protein [Pseudomonadales bacterium]